MKYTQYFLLLILCGMLSVPLLIASELGGIDADIDDFPSRLARSLELRGNGLIPEETPYTNNFLEDYIVGSEYTDQYGNRAERELGQMPDSLNQSIAVLNPGAWGFVTSDRNELYFKGKFGAQMEKGHFALVGVYDVNLGYIDDPDYYGKKWEGKSGRLDRGYLMFFDDRWDIIIGKDHNGWGTGLLMSDSLWSFEQIRYRLAPWDRLRISFIAGFLDKDNVNALHPWQEDVPIVNRYISARKIEFHNRWLSIYGIESVIYGGENRILEPYYLVPLTWIHAEQLNHGINDNTFIGGGIKVVKAPFRIRGELIIDDIQIDSEHAGDQEPAQVAYFGSLEYGTDLLSRMLDLKLSYEASRNRTYNQEINRNRYTFEGSSIGSQLGCDADRTILIAEWWLSGNMQASLGMSHLRDGEGGLFAEWDTPWIDPENPDSVIDYHEVFPSGIVEGTTTFFAGVEGNILSNLNYSLTAEYRLYSNKNNIRGQSDSDFLLGIDLIWDFTVRLNNALTYDN